MPFLEHAGSMRELVTGETLVGSGTQAGWRLQNVDLAGRHFTLKLNGDTVKLLPYSNQHIVAVNGRQVADTGVSLADGDVIGAGSARFTYMSDASRPPAARGGEATGVAHLVDEGAGTAYALAKRSVSLGRDAASHIVLRDPEVSRFHADVRQEAGHFVLYAMGTGGSKVGGEVVTNPRLLEEGDMITIGDTRFRFTRQPLPAGLQVTPLGGTDEQDNMSHRPTAMSSATITGTNGAYGNGEKRGISPGVMIAIAIVVAVVVWLLFLR